LIDSDGVARVFAQGIPRFASVRLLGFDRDLIDRILGIASDTQATPPP
jgi:hypothetical protein